MDGGEDGDSFGPGHNTNNRAKSATSRAQGERRQAAARRRRALPRDTGWGAKWGETQKWQLWNAAIERRKAFKEVEFVPFSSKLEGFGGRLQRGFSTCV